MITLITGGPGTGKTAWLINELIDLRKNEPERELFVHGVRNFTGMLHEQIFCKSQLCDICRGNEKLLTWEASLSTSSVDNDYTRYKYVEDWPIWKSPGSLIIVDEVQRIWRPRTGGSHVPAAVSGLETHRHYGIDFWLISQGPHLFDNAIRLLVGRHVHLVAKWAGRTQYEWPECKQDVQSRVDAVTRPYTLPKRVYSMYSSAEVHTKQQKRKPMSFYFSIFAAIFVIVAVGFATTRFKQKINGPVAGVAAAPAGDSPQSPGSFNSDHGSVYKTAVDIQRDYTPIVPSLPWSAPVYQGLVKPVAAPRIIGCVATPDKCTCYTQQATKVDMDEGVCRLYLKERAFDPFRADKQDPGNEPGKEEKPVTLG